MSAMSHTATGHLLQEEIVMKKQSQSVILFVCLVFSVASIPGNSMAQDFSPRFAVQPAGGLGVPIGDFGDGANPGPTFGGKLRYYPHEFYSADLTFLYGPRYSMKDDIIGVADVDVDGKAKVTQFTLDNNVYLHTKGKSKPFFRIGLGMYRLSAEAESSFQNITVSASESKNKFGINLGPGLEIRTSNKIGLVFDANYHIIFTEGESTKMLSFGTGVNIYLN